MLRSRMFTPAFRFLAALSAASLVAAFTSAVGSSDAGLVDTVLGPLTMGWKGAVGDHLAYTVLLSTAVVSGGLAGILIAFRDADPEAEAQVAQTESVPLTRAPTGTNFLPLLATFGVGILIIGQITDRIVTLAGFIFLFCVAAVWMLRAWAERATGDPEVNRELYHRFLEPFRIPVLSAVVVAVVVIGFSRVLLALSHTGAVAVFGVVAAAFLLVIAWVAAKPSITKSAITIVLFVGAIAVIAAGIAAAVVGERDFEHKGEPTEQAVEAPACAAPLPTDPCPTAPGA